MSARSNPISHIPTSNQKGALLLELLVAISILAIVLSISSQSVYTSLQSGQISSQNDTATSLASEEIEAVRAIADERWQNIYDLTKNSPYYTVQNGTKWATSTASEAVTLNGDTYTRSFVVQNICRDTTATSRLILGLTDGAVGADGTLTTCNTSTGLFDPSTEKVTVTVSYAGSGSPVVLSDYFYRWRNVACPQTSWTTSGSGNTVYPCGTASYDTVDPAITFPSGDLQIQ